MAFRPSSSRSQAATPHVRGEDETEISYLINLIETTAYALLPSCICVLGRHSRAATYLASLYGVGKKGLEGLEYGPEAGSTRVEALKALLDVVETEVGRMMIRDGKRAEKGARAAEEGRSDVRGGTGGSGKEVALVRRAKEKERWDGDDGWE